MHGYLWLLLFNLTPNNKTFTKMEGIPNDVLTRCCLALPHQEEQINLGVGDPAPSSPAQPQRHPGGEEYVRTTL